MAAWKIRMEIEQAWRNKRELLEGQICSLC